MSSLKELTWEHHKEAERQGFVKVLLSGKIHPEFYATYLWNQHKKYDLLEALASLHGLLDDLPDIKRKSKIEADFLELWKKDNPPVIIPAVNEYIAHMRDIMDDAEKLTAHLYVMHMGDLSGGQMIAKRIPGSGTMYQFSADHNELKDAIRSMTNEDMAEEARICFGFATKTFQDLMEIECEHYLEHTD